MSVESPANVARTGLVPEGRLEPNAIGVAQNTVIGMATAAPAASCRADAGRARLWRPPTPAGRPSS